MIGLLVTSVLLIQPLLYLIHHSRTHRHGDQKYGILHRVIGQIFITIGAVNVALGLHYAAAGALFYVFACFIGVSWSFWIIARYLS